MKMPEDTLHKDLVAPTKAKLEAEAAKAVAETRLKLAEAETAEAHAGSAKLELASETYNHEAYRAQDGFHHVYNFGDSVGPTSVRHCLTTLGAWSRMDPECDITVVFNSPGGSVIDGMALFDFLKSLSAKGHHLTTGTRGYAASMAGILLQAGDTRFIGRESYLMIHEISAGTGGKIGEIKDAVAFYDRICARVVDIFVDRSGGKITKRKFISSWTRQDWWIDSEEALKLGFVDQVR